MKIFPDHVIPGMVQFFVQSKDRKRRSCGAGERMPVITKIYEQTADLLRRKVNPCLGKQTDYVGSGQLQTMAGQAMYLRWPLRKLPHSEDRSLLFASLHSA